MLYPLDLPLSNLSAREKLSQRNPFFSSSESDRLPALLVLPRDQLTCSIRNLSTSSSNSLRNPYGEKRMKQRIWRANGDCEH